MFFAAIENDDDRIKIERLYYAYRKLMYKEAFRILNNHTLAEDAVSESFIRIIGSLDKIDEQDIPRTRSFLVIICRNVAKDLYKSKTYLNYDEEAAKDIKDETDPANIMIGKETVSKIAEAIERLDPIYRDAFLLKRVHKMSVKEIADICDISVETVKKRLQRAKSKIAESLKKEGIIHE